MKLVIFIHSLSCGGAERVTAGLANHWANKGWDISVITVQSTESDFYELDAKIKRISLDLARPAHSIIQAIFNNLLRIWKLRNTLKSIQPDTVVSMMSTANIILAFACIGNRKYPCIGSERTHPPMLPLGEYWEQLRKFAYRNLDAIVALTEKTAHWITDNTNARRVVVISNPAQFPLISFNPHIEIPEALAGKRFVLAVGRLSPEKQFDLLLRVFGQVSCEFPEWRLVIVGEGPERKKLEAQARSLNLESAVLFPGRVGNPATWYEHCDLYVMTSKFEGFPNTLVEAMTYGAPAISFDCDTGPRDIISNNENGLLVAADDESKLLDAMRALMLDPLQRERLAKNAVNIREKLSIDKTSLRWEKLFLETINRN